VADYDISGLSQSVRNVRYNVPWAVASRTRNNVIEIS